MTSATLGNRGIDLPLYVESALNFILYSTAKHVWEKYISYIINLVIYAQTGILLMCPKMS